jgi:hypothetical protein
VAILGDSHPQKSVMAGKIDGGYNLSTSAESYIFTYFKVKYYIAQDNFHPSVAVIPIDLHSFSSFRLTRVESQDPAFWSRYVDYLEYGWETRTLESLFPTMIKAEFALLGGLDVIMGLFWPLDNPDSEPLIAGYLPQEDDFSAFTLDERLDRAEERVVFHFSGYTYMEEILVEYFLRLVELLDSHGVKVVLVYYPVTEYYHDLAGEYNPVNEHLATVEYLVADLQPELILDYHNLFFGQPEYFSDSDHLNVRGAEIFTDLLQEEIANAGLLVESSPP